MFFKKMEKPNLTALLSKSINMDYDGFVKTIFKSESLTSEQRIELAVYLLFFYAHGMLVREVRMDLVVAFPTNQECLPMLTNDEKTELAYKYQERMQDYSNIITGNGNDKDKILNISALFLSHFYNLTRKQIAEEKYPQLMASEFLSTKILKSVIEIVGE